MGLTETFFEGLVWVALVLPLFYYVALDVVLGLQKLWIPFGVAVGVTFTCLLYITATSLYFILDSYLKGRTEKRKKEAYAAFAIQKAAEHEERKKAAAARAAASLAMERATSPENGNQMEGPHLEEIDDDDDRAEDMLSSIVTNTVRLDEDRRVSATLSSISISASSFPEQSSARNPSVRNPLTVSDAPENRNRGNGAAGGPSTLGNRVVVAGRGAGEAPSRNFVFLPSSDSSVTSPHTHSTASQSSRSNPHRSGFETKNTVKHNLGSTNNPRRAWQSFTSLISGDRDVVEEDGQGDRAYTRAPDDSKNDVHRLMEEDEHDAGHSPSSESFEEEKQRAKAAMLNSSSAYGDDARRTSALQQQSHQRGEEEQLANVLLAIEEEESVRPVTRFTLEVLPRCRIVLTVAHCLLVWVSSFIVAYYTNVLFAVLPVFSCPVMWRSIAPTAVLLRCTKASVMRRAQQKRAKILAETGQAPEAVSVPCDCICVKVVKFVTHWIVITLVCAISLLLYVAAITLPLIREDELLLEPNKDFMEKVAVNHLNSAVRVPKSVIAVCYLSPLPMVTFMYVATMGGFAMKRTVDRITSDAEQVRALTERSSSARRRSRGASLAVRSLSAVHDKDLVDADATGGTGAAGARQSRRSVPVDIVALTGPNSVFGTTLTDGTGSTLSSIVRSSVSGGQSRMFLGNNTSNMSMMPLDYSSTPGTATASISMGRDSVVHFSRPQSVCAAGGAQAHVAPQLKTVTLLYIAFRDIFGSDGGGGDDRGAGDQSSAVKGNQRGPPQPVGGAQGNNGPNNNTARGSQQVVAAKLEALLQAVEEARSTPTADGAVGKSKKEKEKAPKTAPKKLNARDEARRTDSDAYVLTAHDDAVVLVWGLLPFSSDPVKLAVEKAQRIFARFRKSPKPYAALANAGSHGSGGKPPHYELTAAVVYAPHTLVGMLGSSNAANPLSSFRSVHFFSPDQHTIGTALLQRGFRLHCEFHGHLSPTAKSAARPVANAKGGKAVEASLSTSFSSREFLHSDSGKYYQGILLDSRAVHAAAAHILARPCGVIGEEMMTGASALTFFGPGGCPEASAKSARQAPNPSAEGSGRKGKFTVMYDFVTFLSEREEEWHLVVQRNERLSFYFRFLLEATQSLHQNNVKKARETLQKSIQEERRKRQGADDESESVGIAKIFLTDLAYVELRRRLREEEEKGIKEILVEEF